jgi:transcriptional regulator with XRE-family HTH domain
MSSSVKPDGDKIERLRSGRGWTVEDLARKAGCVPKSIYNAEQGKNIRRTTLAEIAAALKVEPSDLLAERQPLANRIRIQVVIEGDLEQMRQSGCLDGLVGLLHTVLKPTGEVIQLGDFKAGSVILTLEFEEEDALRLVALFLDFKELAREAIRATPEGEAFLRGLPLEVSEADRIRTLLELVDAIKELRIPAEPVFAEWEIGGSGQQQVSKITFPPARDMPQKVSRPTLADEPQKRPKSPLKDTGGRESGEPEL